MLTILTWMRETMMEEVAVAVAVVVASAVLERKLVMTIWAGCEMKLPPLGKTSETCNKRHGNN